MSGLLIKKIIFEDVAEFLKGLTLSRKIKYKVIGGMAIKAWMNPNLHGMTDFEKSQMATSDWDIVIEGTNRDARNLTIDISKFLEKKYRSFVTTRLDDTLKLSADDDIYIYQVGILDDGIGKVEWIVDVHGEESIDEFSIIKMENDIWYSNLKDIIEQTEYALEKTGLKAVKRGTRLRLISEAIKEIKRLNPKMYENICFSCAKWSSENFTGLKLNCADLEIQCKSEKSSSLSEKLQSERLRRMKLLEDEDF